MPKKITTDKELRHFGVRVMKRADKLLKRGKIDFVTWDDLRRKGLRMATPRMTAKLTGL